MKTKKQIKAAYYAAFRRFIKGNKHPEYIRRWVGLNFLELRAHIESLWIEGMTWDNYGKFWIVDHLIPLRLFDLQSEEAMLLCWHPVNLHPMIWGDDPWKHGAVDFSIKLLKNRPSFVAPRLTKMAEAEIAKQNKYEVNAEK